MAADFLIKQGDLLPQLLYALQNSDGSAHDLTGATVSFVMRPASSALMSISAPAQINGAPTNGNVQYNWQGLDTGIPGVYYANFIVVSAGKQESFPLGKTLIVEVLQSVNMQTSAQFTAQTPQDPYTGIYFWTRDLLGLTFYDMTDDRLYKYAQSEASKIIYEYPAIGSYSALVGNDKLFFDEGIGHLVAVRLRPTIAKRKPLGEITTVRHSATMFGYTDPTRRRVDIKTIEEVWMETAWACLKNVSAIGPTFDMRTAQQFLLSVTREDAPPVLGGDTVEQEWESDFVGQGPYNDTEVGFEA